MRRPSRLPRSVASAAPWLWSWPMGKPLRLVAPVATLAIGLAQVTGFMLFQTWALVEGGPGKTAVLIFTMPIWTLLIGWPFWVSVSGAGSGWPP